MQVKVQQVQVHSLHVLLQVQHLGSQVGLCWSSRLLASIPCRCRCSRCRCIASLACYSRCSTWVAVLSWGCNRLVWIH